MKTVYQDEPLMPVIMALVHDAAIKGREIRHFEFTEKEVDKIKRETFYSNYMEFRSPTINKICGIPFIII